MKCFINEYYYAIVIGLLTGLFLLTILMLAGCSSLEHKAIAGETKGVYADISVPSIGANGLASFLSVKIGAMTTKWTSAPDNGKTSIKDTYQDISFWTMSGEGTSELSCENYSDTNKGLK